jgi:predicted ATPase
VRIDRIKLNNYKRFGAFEVALDPQFNLFVGENASGKTTILDAVTVGLDSWFIGMKGVQGIGSIDQDEVHVIPYPHGDVVSFEKQFPA